jgi:hypothetical protein
MPDEPYDPKKHGEVITTPAAATTGEPYDPTKHGAVLPQPDQYGVFDVGQTITSRPPHSGLQFADDVVRNIASGATFGGADKLAAGLDSLFGKGSYDELLAKQRQETEAAGGRLGPVGTFLAQAGGGMLTGAALLRGGITLLGRATSLPQKILAGTGEGAAYGALSGALHTDTGNVEDYLKNAGTGGLLGGLTGGAISGVAAGVPRLITPFPTTDPVRAKAMQTLADAGVDVSAGVKTGAPKLRLAEDVVGKTPGGGPNVNDQQMAQVTQAVMKKAGIGGGGAATPDVVDKGFDQVGGTINRLQKPYTLQVDDPLLNAAARVESETKPLVEQGQQGPLQHFIDKITSGEKLPPEMAQSIRTQLNEAIKDATGQHQRGLVQLKTALDQTLERAMQNAGDSAGVAALQLARNQYAHLHILSDALNASGAAGMRGELTPSALATAVRRSVGKTDFTRGQGDLNELARASAGYLQPPKDSFTSTREGYWNPARWALGLGGRLGLNNPLMQKYWGNQALPIQPSGAAIQPAVPGLVSTLGPADRIMQGLLMGGP